MPGVNRYYTKLPGSRSAFLGLARNSLWIADDHILHVINRGYTEEYKRFYFRDIQAVVLQRTGTGEILSYLLGLAAACSGLLLLLGWKIWDWRITPLWISAINFGFWFLIFLIHILRGATCSCTLQTAVQTENLPSLHRMRAGKRVLSILKDRAEAVQGTVAAESLAGLSEAQTASGDVFSKRPELVPLVTVYDSHVHAILFAVLLIDGIRITSNLFYTQFLLYTLGLALYALSVGLVIVALIRQRNTNLPSVAKGMTWCALIYLWISAAAWYVYGIIASIDRPDAGLNYWKLLQSISERPVLESVPQLILHSFSAFCSLVFGLGGLISVWKFYDRRK